MTLASQIFSVFFNGLLREVNSSLKVEGSDRIYQEWISTDKINKSFVKKLEQVGVSKVEDIKRIVEILTQCKNLEQKLIKKLQQNNKNEPQDAAVVQQLIFEFLIHRNNFNRERTQARLEELKVRLSEPEMFFARLDSLLYIGRQDFEDYFDQARKIVTQEFESFKGFNESQQREVAEVLFGKNVSYHALILYFDSLGVKNSLELLNSLFSEESKLRVLSESTQHEDLREDKSAFLTDRINQSEKLGASKREQFPKQQAKVIGGQRKTSLKGLRRMNSIDNSSKDVLGVLDEYDQDAIADLLQKNGIQPNDQRFQTSEVSTHNLIRNCINGNMVIPDWDTFTRDIQEIYDLVKKIKKGENAGYIPELAEVNPDYFGISICTIDGQIMEIGDTKVPFSAQSCSKPITYCIAVQQHNAKHQQLNVSGQDYVHNFVGREPSGRNFNDLSLNPQNIPHNPMINAGSIMSVSMIAYTLPPAHRYKLIKNYWERLAGVPKNSGKDDQIDIDNSVYLSEKLDANRNWALGYLMQEKKAFQQGMNPQFKREWKKTDLEDNLDLYFQCCSIKVNCTQMAKIGASLANGGICPFTNDAVLDPDNVKNCLSLMYSCGLYDYSGEWSYLVGIPAKSGVSGIIYAVIPNVMCIAVYSPPLDTIGNSVKGVEFFKLFTSKFKFHVFDSFLVNSEKKTITKEHAYQKDFKKFLLLEAASRSDIELIRKLLAQKLDVNSSDYDHRTALHVSVSNKNFECVKFLVEHGADPTLKDRWGNTAYDDAMKEDSQEIIQLLSSKSINRH